MTYPNDLATDLAEAIAAEHAVRFVYHKPGEDAPLGRVFSPWEIDDELSTVLGWDHGRDGIRRFNLADIIGEVTVDLTEHYAVPSAP